jgi:hypothetical protein
LYDDYEESLNSIKELQGDMEIQKGRLELADGKYKTSEDRIVANEGENSCKYHLSDTINGAILCPNPIEKKPEQNIKLP